MHLKNLLSFSYWFSQPDVLYHGVVRWAWWAWFVGLIVAGAALLFIRRRQTDTAVQTVLLRFSICVFTMGIFGTLWFYLRQEYVLFLGWRFWLVPWFIVFALWLYQLIRYVVKRLPQIRVEHQKQEEREKYLPKNK